MSYIKKIVTGWAILCTFFLVDLHLTSPVYGQGFNSSLSAYPKIYTKAAVVTECQDLMISESHQLSASGTNLATTSPKDRYSTEQAEYSAGLQGSGEITFYRFITSYTMILGILFLFIITYKERKLNLIEEKIKKVKKSRVRYDSSASISGILMDGRTDELWPESLNVLFNRVIELLKERRPYRHCLYNVEEMAEQLDTYVHYIEAAVKVNMGRSFEELLLLYRMNDVLEHIELNRGLIDNRTLMLKCGFMYVKQLENVFESHIGVDIDTYRNTVQNSD